MLKLLRSKFAMLLKLTKGWWKNAPQCNGQAAEIYKRLVEECSLVKRTIDFAIRCRALLLYALYLTLSDALSKSSNWERGKERMKINPK